MKNKNAIRQMLDGKRGTLESIPQSAKSEELLKNASILEMFFVSKLRKKKADLLDAFEDFTTALAEAHESDMEDCYKEAFSFGLQIGIEITEQSNLIDKLSATQFQTEERD